MLIKISLCHIRKQNFALLQCLKSLVNLSESSAGLCIVYTGCEVWGGGGGLTQI
jgi:hypothetical protein